MTRPAPPAELRPILSDRFRERDAKTWLVTLGAASVPCGPINDILGAFGSTDAAALGMTVELDHSAWGQIRQVGIPFRLSATPASIRSAPPALGEHTDEILAGLGYDPGEIASLRDRGIV